ncbi:MAG: hypothetical protein APR54_12945 [Candidatus Cloacimonas sp. SDB]|nr:MAG: hypothetical protein APR54_12945 [Candidatus Cloacimonas sp. SDB]
MFSKNITLVTIIMIVFIMSFVALLAECDMFAMISQKDHYISWKGSNTGSYNDPYDYFNWLRTRSTNSGSKPNPDGYGLVYYPEDGSFNPNTNSLYLTGFDSYYYRGNTYNNNYPLYNGPLNDAEDWIMDNDTEASIVFGHARQTGSNTGSGSHPFYFDLDGNGVGDEDYYVFMHNGTIDPTFKSYISTYLNSLQINGTPWLTLHPFNSDGNIDSELYFHYLMTYVVEYGNVVEGIYKALNEIEFEYDDDEFYNVRQSIYNEDREANFLLSDGESIYAFRNTPLTDTNHCLGFFESGSFTGITTLNHNSYDIEIQQYELAVFTPYGQPKNDNYNVSIPLNPTRIYDFLKPFNTFPDIVFLNGSVTEDIIPNYTANGYPNAIVVGDVYIDSDVEITSNTHVAVVGHHNININAQVLLSENASLNLYHSTTVNVNAGGELFLDWGSTLTGSIPTTYEATPPGHPVGGEKPIPGDRIICSNGGRVTTPNDIQNPGAEITIASYSGNIWDGIQIKNPSTDEEYWFVNCDISGIYKLTMEANDNGNGDLYLYSTNFHDCGQLIVRDGHKLTYHGTSGEYSEYKDNQGPICAYESPVDIDYVEVTDNNTGIYLYESSRTPSRINNSIVSFNNGDGIKPNGVTFDLFNGNDIEENTAFGMLCYDGTLFEDYEFTNILIRNNGFAEYAGWQTTFEMDYSAANITIADNNYGSGSDYYLLMNLRWDGINAVDISGTNITSFDHLFPTNSAAWTFSGGITDSKELLDAASIDFANEDYDSAKQILYQLLDEYLYSKEAVTAVYYLYHIESLSTENFAGLRDYLLALNVDEDTYIYDTIKKVSAKTLMKEKDYVSAITELEDIIINSELPDEVISAMIDEGYCYLKLSESGDRALPENCTVKTATLDEYQARVREMEIQYTFYPEEQNQNTTPISGNIVMHSNHPNPFNPSTTIRFDLAQASMVSVEVFNIKGQKVRTLLNEHLDNGTHSIYWKGTDNSNKSVASGLYFYKLTSGKDTVTHKMLLLK